MKKSALIILIIVLCSCSTPTLEPTAAQVMPTNTPAPASCDEVHGNCFELSYDGESCIYDGPTDFPTGPITLLFINESDGAAGAGLLRLVGNKTLQDMREYNGEDPTTKHAPDWSRIVFESKFVVSGQNLTLEGVLVEGVHGMICINPKRGVWFGGGFTVKD